MLMAMPGWSIGTSLGIIAGNILPERVVSALSVALFGMFLAVIIPPARKNKVVAVLVALSFVASFACSVLPLVSTLSDGTRDHHPDGRDFRRSRDSVPGFQRE